MIKTIFFGLFVLTLSIGANALPSETSKISQKKYSLGLEFGKNYHSISGLWDTEQNIRLKVKMGKKLALSGLAIEAQNMITKNTNGYASYSFIGVESISYQSTKTETSKSLYTYSTKSSSIDTSSLGLTLGYGGIWSFNDSLALNFELGYTTAITETMALDNYSPFYLNQLIAS
jgi:hypothetical protein